MKQRETISDITVRRIDGKSIELSWKSRRPGSRVSVWRGVSPDAVDRLVVRDMPTAENSIRITGLPDTERHYFRIGSNGSKGRTVAERLIPVEGTFNFRDMGGYETSEGTRVKWGLVFRSDNLSRLTDLAMQLVRNMNIGRICDFRSKAEADARPDRLPERTRIVYLHLPVASGRIDGVSAFDKIKRGDTSWFTDDFMLNGYLKGLDAHAEIWGRFLTSLAEADGRPLLFHCSAGKDRTGIAAALLLLTLGVPEETVIANHQLSNTCIAGALEDTYNRIREYDVDPGKLAAYFSAPLECIEALLHHLRRRYGSVDRYWIEQAGLGPEVLKRVQTALVE